MRPSGTSMPEPAPRHPRGTQPVPEESGRRSLLRRAFLLEVLTVTWNALEGVIAVAAGVAADSIALLGFGMDSFVEMASGLVLLWRVRVERREQLDLDAIERLDRKAHRLVGGTLVLLAAWIVWEAGRSLWLREEPEASPVGMVLLALSLPVMAWLAPAKRRAAAAMGSRALEADAFQTSACWWLSLIALGGIGLNAGLGWWWADPLAALGISVILVREAREAWPGHP